MKTCKENTRQVIASIYGRSTKEGILKEIDVDYLQHIIEVTSVNRKELYNMIHSNRKADSIAKNIICSIINIDLYYQDYKTICTYKQIKDILKNDFNYNIDNLIDILADWITAERKELNENL